MKRYSTAAACLVLALLPARADDAKPAPPGVPEQPQPAAELPKIQSTDDGGLRAALGKEVVVCGKVSRVNSWQGGITFINLKGGFAIICFKKNLSNFPEPPDKMCDGKTVEVTGTVSEHKGKLQRMFRSSGGSDSMKPLCHKGFHAF